MPRQRHVTRRIPSADRDQSIWCHHHDEGRPALFPGTQGRTYHPGNVDLRTHRTCGARTLRICKVRGRGLFGVAVQGDGTAGRQVTIIEPGGFRTDFAGSSTELSEGRPEYDSTVGASVRFQRSYNGNQPGDPAKAAAVLLHIASLAEPPLRLLLGSDCFAAAEKSALEKLESDRRWKQLSLSTDHSSGENLSRIRNEYLKD